MFQVLETYVASVRYKCLNYFGRMLQVFHLDIAKVDMELHMLQWHRWLTDGGATGLGADLDGGSIVQGREEGGVARRSAAAAY